MSERYRNYRLARSPEDEGEVSCSVCGFGLRSDRTGESDREQIRYAADPDDGVLVAVIHESQGCPFCGSPNWRTGSAPDLLRGW